MIGKLRQNMIIIIIYVLGLFVTTFIVGLFWNEIKTIKTDNIGLIAGAGVVLWPLLVVAVIFAWLFRLGQKMGTKKND